MDESAAADASLAERQAKEMYAAVRAKGGLEAAQDLFTKYLSTASDAHVEAIKSAYEDEYDVSLHRAIQRAFKGYTRAGLQALLVPAHDWYAARLQAAFDGWGTCDKAVCRILGCNDKRDVGEISRAFERKYQKPLKKAIAEECSGNYKRMCVAWISLPDLLEQPREIVEIDEAEAVEDVPEERPAPPAETIRGALGPVRVGDRVQTLNDAEDNDEADNMWYTGTLVSIDEATKTCMVQYDGDDEAEEEEARWVFRIPDGLPFWTQTQEEHPALCAFGEVQIGSRVQTKDDEEGGDNLWYTATVESFSWSDKTVTVRYDEEKQMSRCDTETAEARWFHILPPDAPGMTQMQPDGKPVFG